MVLIHLHLPIAEIVAICQEIRFDSLIGGQRSSVHYVESTF